MKQETIRHSLPIYFSDNVFVCGKCDLKLKSFMAMAKHFADFHLAAFLKLVTKIDSEYDLLRKKYQSDRQDDGSDLTGYER